MKSASIVSTSAPSATDATPRVTAQMVGDDGVTRTYASIGPAPISDAAALWHYLAAYDAAFVTGLAQASSGTAVAPGALTPPVV